MVRVIIISEPVDIDLDISHLEVALLGVLILLIVVRRVEDDLGGGAAAVHEYVKKAAVGEWDDARLLADDKRGIFEKEVDILNVDAGGGGVAGVKGVVICELCLSKSFEECAVWDKVFCGKVIN